MSIYQDRGYDNRADYIESLAEECGMGLQEVWALANLLGPDEDFDGLVIACEDAATEAWDAE